MSQVKKRHVPYEHVTDKESPGSESATHVTSPILRALTAEERVLGLRSPCHD